jgi:outer membrane biogenesis lipoprotein LolB
LELGYEFAFQRDREIEMARIMSLSNASALFHLCCSASLQIVTVLGFMMPRSQCFYIAIIALALAVSCAPLQTLPPAKPISQDQAHRLIAQLRAQADEVFSFVGAGKLLLRERRGETDMNLIAVGQRPSRIRLELTHTWGKPLIFLVADKQNTSVLSFVEHTFYSGPSKQLNRRQFFPFEIDLEIVWVILSGRIPVLPHCNVASLRQNEITLFDGQGDTVERLTFSRDRSIPTSIHLPKQGLTVTLSQFKAGTMGPYPSKVSISQGDERHAEIRYTSLEFNRSIPEELFALNPTPDVQIIQEDYQGP